jgi:hypothetical protein
LDDEDGGVGWGCDSQVAELFFEARPAVQTPQLVREHSARYPIEIWESLRGRRDVIDAPPGHEEGLGAGVGGIFRSRAAHAVGQHSRPVLLIDGLKMLHLFLVGTVPIIPSCPPGSAS